jgi:ATP-dependent helicase Lhr and Lhr-like helicase
MELSNLEHAFLLLHPKLKLWMKDHGWAGLSAIQKAAFLPVYNGDDCILEAPTAGGKTEAVFFPVLSREANRRTESIQVLYLAPLRALLNNVELRVLEYSGICGLRAFKWHGDVDNKEKWGEFNNPSHVLMTTPESMEAIFQGKPGWHKYFRNLSTVVIDEAHNFSAGDRGSHLASILERLDSGIGIAPQRIALTATIGNPDRLLIWLAGVDRKPGKRIHVNSVIEKKQDFKLELFNDLVGNVENLSENLPEYRLFKTLRDGLIGHRSLVFVRSRNQAEKLAKAFAEDAKVVNRPLKVRTHHSAVSKFFREEAEERLKIKGESGIDAVLNTSTLELGIDIGEIDRVFQIDGNPSPSALLQRVGRTGRRPECPVQFFRGLLTDPDDLVLMTGVVSLCLKGISEALIIPSRSFHILVHQIICIANQAHGINSSKVWEVLRRCDSFKDITYDEYIFLISHLLETRILRDVDGDLVVGEEGEKKFLGAGGRRLFAVFETGPMFEVFEGKNHVGSLDSGFVESLCKEMPFYFVLAGILWKAEKVNVEKRFVNANRSQAGDAPVWNTFGGHDVSWEVAQEVGVLLNNGRAPEFLESEARSVFLIRCNQWESISWSPGQVVWSSMGNQLITLAGDRINRTLAKLLLADNVIPKNKVASNYASIDFKPQNSCVSIKESVNQYLDALKGISVDEMAKKLKIVVSNKPFSRLTACLPPQLLVATYIDRALDCNGLKACLIKWG